MKPGTALNIVCYALGGVVLACAAVQLVRYFAVERGVFQSQLTLVSGIVCLALGAFLIIRSDIVVSILPIVFGLFVIFDSLGRGSAWCWAWCWSSTPSVPWKRW